MANVKREITYRCRDDCRMEGCPSHEGTLEFQSTSNHYHFIMNGKDKYFEQNELQAIIDLIDSLNRADCIQIQSKTNS